MTERYKRDRRVTRNEAPLALLGVTVHFGSLQSPACIQDGGGIFTAV